MLNDEHDPAPDGGCVDHLFALAHGFVNIFSGFFRRDRKGCAALRGFEHFGFHETRLDGQHIDAVTGEPVAKRFEIGGQPCFGCVVAGVANTSAVTCHRGDADDLSRLCALEHLCHRAEPGHRANQIDFDHLAVIFEVVVFQPGG